MVKQSLVRILVEWRSEKELRETIFEVCLRLWNFSVRHMGVSQVAAVFSDAETDDDLQAKLHNDEADRWNVGQLRVV